MNSTDSDTIIAAERMAARGVAAAQSRSDLPLLFYDPYPPFCVSLADSGFASDVVIGSPSEKRVSPGEGTFPGPKPKVSPVANPREGQWPSLSRPSSRLTGSSGSSRPSNCASPIFYCPVAAPGGDRYAPLDSSSLSEDPTTAPPPEIIESRMLFSTK